MTSQEYATGKGHSLWQMVFRKVDSHKQNKKMGFPILHHPQKLTGKR